MSAFVFKKYSFIEGEAKFYYAYEDQEFCESVTFSVGENYNEAALERSLQLAFLVVGTSYFKAFPTREIVFKNMEIDEWQAHFCNTVYQEGLSQFAFENELTRSDLAHFEATGTGVQPVNFTGTGSLVLQSGGKDSLLLATMLEDARIDYAPMYITNAEDHPKVLDTLKSELIVCKRTVDKESLLIASQKGGRNGHVPVTFIVLAYALIQAILLNKNSVLSAIGHEGEEPHAFVGDLPVTHQWSKTWAAEQLFSRYVHAYVSPDINVGSPLRRYSELKIAELFALHSWKKYGNAFSSCNVANYKQGHNNTTLSWCGNCPKCANSYLLFAPFIESKELHVLLGGQLFEKPELADTFKGLLGIDEVMKPFECVGEVNELRKAYSMSQSNGYEQLPFTVPVSDFEMTTEYPAALDLTAILNR